MSKVKKPATQERSSIIGRFSAIESLGEPKWSWLVAALAIATLSLAYPVFTGGFLVNPHSDQYIAGYGFRHFAAQSLRAGEGFPQWNPYMFGGLPYVAAMHGDIFYPTFLLRLVLPTDLAMTLGFIIHTFLAGAFTLGFLRALGMSGWVSVYGAVAYLLAGPIASYASPGHDGKLFVSALLPLSLWMLTRAISTGPLWAWGMFALSVGLAVLSPHPQLLQYFLLVNGAYALFLVWRELPEGAAAQQSPPSESGQPPASKATYAVSALGKALGMVLLGLGIGAIQYWPVLGYVSSSPRADGRAYAFASSYSWPPEELINVYLPQFSGILDSYWGRNGIHLHSEYLGIVVLMLAPLAFGVGARRYLARFWLGVATVSLLWALGAFTPFFQLVYWLVPGTKYFRAPSTIMYVFAFAICLLSALGFERVLAGRITSRFLTRYLAGWTLFGAIIAVLVWSGPLPQLAMNLGRTFARSAANDPRFLDFMQRGARAMSIGAARSLAVVLSVGLLMLLFNRRKLKPAAFAGALVALCALDLWSVSHHYWIFWKPARELYASDPIIDYLREQPQPGRVLVYTKTADYRTTFDPYFGARGFGEGAGFMVHGVRTVTGYQGNVLARYEALSDGASLIAPAFWQHENVRWLYTNEPIADSVLTKINGPLVNSAGSVSYLYEMPGENSYAWVAATIGAQDDSTAVRDILNARHDPRAFVAVDTGTTIGGQRVAGKPALLPEPDSTRTTVSEFGAGHATIQLGAPAAAGSALVVAENYYKGWQATVDGKAVPVVRAAFNLIGVPLPAGARVVSLRFQDERYNTGRLVTLLCLTLVAALFVPALRQQRRK